MLTGTPNTILSAIIAKESMTAVRNGVPVENVISTLIYQAEMLQMALPVVNAALDSRSAP